MACRHILFPCGILAILVMEQANPLPAKEKAREPAIEFVERVFDFGLCPPGQETILTHDFVLKNTGDAPLELLSVHNDCRTIAICPERTIPPAQSSFVRVTSTVPAENATSGGFRRTIRVLTNDRAHPYVELHMKAKFALSLKWEPERIKFGPIAEGEKSEILITIESRTTETFGILSWKCKSQNLQAEVKSIKASSAHRKADDTPQQEIIVRLDGDIPTGLFVDTLILDTDRSDISSIEVPVSAQVLPAVRVEPSSVYLGIVRPGEIVRQDIAIRTTEPGFQIRRIVNHIAGLKATATRESDGYRIRLVFDTDRGEEIVDGQLILRTNSPVCKEIVVGVRGLVKGEARGEREQQYRK